ncbi:MAG: hypothetical protein R3E64_13940 [Halioglobus sp.]
MSSDIKAFEATIESESKTWKGAAKDNTGLIAAAKKLEPIAETSRDLIKQIDQLYKFVEKQAKGQQWKRLEQGD